MHLFTEFFCIFSRKNSIEKNKDEFEELIDILSSGIVSFTQKNEKGKIVHKQLEADFVCNKGSKRYYVQSAFSIPDNEKMKQESNSLLRIDETGSSLDAH